jgi:hypothetical protein
VNAPPAWPGMVGRIEELRANPERIEQLGTEDIVDCFDEISRGLRTLEGEQADEGKRREQREAEGVEGASEASRRRDQPSATRPPETAPRNKLARPVNSEIVAERDAPRRCSVVMIESADAGSSGMSALSGSPSTAFSKAHLPLLQRTSRMLKASDFRAPASVANMTA